MCKECICCGFRRGDGDAPEADGQAEAGGRMSDVSQGSVGGCLESTKKCLTSYRERKKNTAREDWLPGTRKKVGEEKGTGKEGACETSPVWSGVGTTPLGSHQGGCRGEEAA